MGSSRLPGKVLARLGGVPALSRVLRRTRSATRVDDVIVATTDSAEDDAVERLAAAEGCGTYRGSRDDVLDRYWRTAARERPVYVVRITADCPLVMPRVVDRVVEVAIAGGFDYASNTLVRTYPKGLDVECFTLAALERAARDATDANDREHVTPYLKRHPALFRPGDVRARTDRSDLRWTLDHPEDLAFLDRVFQRMPAPDCVEDVVGLVEGDPELAGLHRAAVESARVTE
jgi:spore coat polysaccharide biosynthesis protein SpsF (cytidylyltransferase family)